MRETPEEVAELQALIDRTMAKVNPHFAGIVTKKNRLTAQQVCAYLQGTRIVALATANQKGEPRVSPLDSLFLHGRFTLSTGLEATRIGHLRANPACSAVYLEGDKVAVVVNGAVEWIERSHPDHDEIHGAWQKQYHSDPYTWGNVAFFRINPTALWTYAQRPKEFPEHP
jgi:Pyridoxamine 5'-phosphate oxidase